MGLFDLFPILFIACFAAFFIEFSFCYPSFEDCSPSSCNNSTIRYPFVNSNSRCSYYNSVDCPDDQTTLLSAIDIRGLCSEYLYIKYRVLGGITQSSYSTRTIRIALHTPIIDDCFTFPSCYSYPNGYYTFYLNDKYEMGTILVCNEKQPSYTANFKEIQCLHCRSTSDSCFFIPPPYSVDEDDSCTKYSLVVPADQKYNISDEKNLLKLMEHTGFEIEWNIRHYCQTCETSGGICYSEYACICTDGPHRYSCSDGILLNKMKWWKTPKYIAAMSVLSSIFATATIIIIYVKINRKKRKQREEEEWELRAYMDPLDSRPPSFENFLHGGIPNRYSYRQIKRHTNNFADRLGQGGFGTVYKGKLLNECLVAIKILDKSKHSRNQFMSEVATLGRIHHLHLVRLLGYCFEGSKSALVYEYMVNGSLEKYIHGDDQIALGWNQLYSIAMGTARGIAYLHDECRSRILHCDIKPHNILLDVNFSPKVADFGLAKLTDREETHVSLTGARGTPGYVAPEVWSRINGPVSDRSDVYSYGMLLMEMVGGRKNFDMKATRSSKFFYPEWAFKQVEKGEFGRLREGNIADEEDKNMAKKLCLVGLWCIQYSPSQRPSMSRVIHMLEGRVEITIPPQPFPVETSMQTTVLSTESSSTM